MSKHADADHEATDYKKDHHGMSGDHARKYVAWAAQPDIGYQEDLERMDAGDDKGADAAQGIHYVRCGLIDLDWGIRHTAGGIPESWRGM